ncbi:MAG: helix-turn-helix transcriptional regulator [Clostridia bacterium]|jgi:AraC-like DNA-binding protein|nr:helix-turn-helix transcriptional regulator [Clostridia bacterium]
MRFAGTSDIPFLNVSEVIHIERENTKIKTTNKSCYVISCRISGESTFYYNGQELTVKRGDILFVPFGATYIQSTEYEEIVCLDLETCANLQDELQIFKTDCPDYICSLFIKCSECWQGKQARYQYRLMSLLYEILSFIDITPNDQTEHENPLFELARKELFKQLYDTDLSIAAICDRVGISRTYFNKFFKESERITPSEYINKKRIQKAQMLLKGGDFTNEEISYLCGFNDVKYFYVVFKKLTGITTKEYTKN